MPGSSHDQLLVFIKQPIRLSSSPVLADCTARSRFNLVRLATRPKENRSILTGTPRSPIPRRLGRSYFLAQLY